MGAFLAYFVNSCLHDVTHIISFTYDMVTIKNTHPRGLKLAKARRVTIVEGE